MDKHELMERLVDDLASELVRDVLVDAILGHPDNGETWGLMTRSKLRANWNAWRLLGFSEEECNQMLDLLKEKLNEKEALGA